VRAVFDDIRAARKSDFVNNFRRVLAFDPARCAAHGADRRESSGPR
jgi:hypothetical protein